jgi:hypothetical protein
VSRVFSILILSTAAIFSGGEDGVPQYLINTLNQFRGRYKDEQVRLASKDGFIYGRN